MLLANDYNPERSPEPDDFAIGPSTGFFGAMSASYNSGLLNDTSFGLEVEFEDQDQKNLDRIYELTGERLDKFDKRLYFNIASDVKDQNFFVGSQDKDYLNKNFQTYLAQEQRIEALKKQYPEIKTRSEIFKDIYTKAKDLRTDAAIASQTSTFLGGIGSFAGSVGSSFSLSREPLNILTAPLGAESVGVKTLARAALAEGAIGAATETLNQLTGISQNRALLDNPATPEEILKNVAAAGVGAAGIRTGVHVGSKLIKVGAEKVRGKYEELKNILRMSDEELLRDFKEKVPNPDENQKAAMNILEKEVATERTNPFKDTPEGLREHNARMVEATKQLDEAGFSGHVREDLEVPESIKKTDEEISAQRDKEFIRQAEDIKRNLDSDTTKPIEDYAPDSLAKFIKDNGGIVDEEGKIISKPTEDLVQTVDGKKIEGRVGDLETQIQTLKRLAFDRGYFPEKPSLSDLTDDEFLGAVARDIRDNQHYNIKDREKISTAKHAADNTDYYKSMGITNKMSTQEIADRLKAISDEGKVTFPERQAAGAQDVTDRALAEKSDLDMLDGNSEAFSDSILDDMENGLGEFKDLDLDEEVAVGARVDENGDIVTEYKTVKDVIQAIKEDDKFALAVGECGLVL